MALDGFTATVILPVELHTRARAISKRTKTPLTTLLRDSLAEKIDYLEAKARADEERRIAEQDAAKARRIAKRHGTGPFAPLPPAPPPAPEAPREDFDPLEPLYEHHAKIILAALGNPTEMRLRVREAVSAVTKQAPLTHPGENNIVVKIEQIVLRLRSEMPPEPPEPLPRTRTEDPLTGQEVAIDKMKTHGDV